MNHTEAVCGRCGETFIVTGEETALEHYQTEDGEPCEGQGKISGTWVYKPDAVA